MKRDDHVSLAIEAKRVTLQTAMVSLQMLTIDKRKVTLSLFRQFPESQIIDPETMKLCGTPWGLVNYYFGDCRADHLHVVWEDEGRLYRACVWKPPKQFTRDRNRNDTVNAHWFSKFEQANARLASRVAEYIVAKRDVLYCADQAWGAYRDHWVRIRAKQIEQEYTDPMQKWRAESRAHEEFAKRHRRFLFDGALQDGINRELFADWNTKETYRAEFYFEEARTRKRPAPGFAEVYETWRQADRARMDRLELNSEGLNALEAWRARYDELARLEQIFIAL
jgi:hypothetical protein